MGFLDFLKPQPKPCNVCQMPTNDIAVINGRENEFYCREHLWQKFVNVFKNAPFNMVVCKPDFKNSSAAMYPYYPLAEMADFSFENDSIKNSHTLLESIKSKKCAVCSDEAVILYFESVPSDSTGPLLAELKIDQGQFLCSKHALDRIEDVIINNPEPFSDNGLIFPYNGEGVYVSTKL